MDLRLPNHNYSPLKQSEDNPPLSFRSINVESESRSKIVFNAAEYDTNEKT